MPSDQHSYSSLRALQVILSADVDRIRGDNIQQGFFSFSYIHLFQFHHNSTVFFKLFIGMEPFGAFRSVVAFVLFQNRQNDKFPVLIMNEKKHRLIQVYMCTRSTKVR